MLPLAKKENGKLYYIVCDHLGTPREFLTEDGQLVWAAEYTTWGSVRRLWQAYNDDHDPTRGAFQGYDGDGNPVYGTRPSNSTQGNLALKPLDDPDPYFCPIRFQGQWADEETELYYNRFRYYDPLSAQYCSPDPIGLLGGLRSQGYVDSPSIWIDPFGLNDRTPGKTRLRHYTSKSGLAGIEKDMKIKASDQNKVFNVRAKGKPLSETDAKKKLAIKLGKGKCCVEYDADPSELIPVKGIKGANEINIKGDVDLTGRNPKIFRRK